MVVTHHNYKLNLIINVYFVVFFYFVIFSLDIVIYKQILLMFKYNLYLSQHIGAFPVPQGEKFKQVLVAFVIVLCPKTTHSSP